jgi:predicted dehydrogenase
MNDELRLGVVGFGGFGLFAVQHFMQVPGIRLVGMSGTHRPAAYAAAERFGVPEIEDVGEMVRRDDIDLVYIATPPFLHYEQAMPALEAGKHVICEKPLAIEPVQAEEMVRLARRRDVLLVANLMQRYNPLYDTVGKLIGSGALGEVLHGYFENYATDEGLDEGHWFWDRAKSGGIFIEHGVHFFDMVAGWLGPGRVEAAQRSLRPGSGIEEQVQCSVRYGDGVLFNFYHGFHQPGRMDRQQLRLVFERGDVTLHEWVPTRLHLHAVVSERNTRTLCELLPGARLNVSAVYSGSQRQCRGRHKSLDVYQMIELRYGAEDHKMHRYGELLEAMLRDQTTWIRDRGHTRRITEQNGVDSLAAAAEADRLALENERAAPSASQTHRPLGIGGMERA